MLIFWQGSSNDNAQPDIILTNTTMIETTARYIQHNDQKVYGLGINESDKSIKHGNTKEST